MCRSAPLVVASLAFVVALCNQLGSAEASSTASNVAAPLHNETQVINESLFSHNGSLGVSKRRMRLSLALVSLLAGVAALAFFAFCRLESWERNLLQVTRGYLLDGLQTGWQMKGKPPLNSVSTVEFPFPMIPWGDLRSSSSLWKMGIFS